MPMNPKFLGTAGVKHPVSSSESRSCQQMGSPKIEDPEGPFIVSCQELGKGCLVSGCCGLQGLVGIEKNQSSGRK